MVILVSYIILCKTNITCTQCHTCTVLYAIEARPAGHVYVHMHVKPQSLIQNHVHEMSSMSNISLLPLSVIRACASMLECMCEHECSLECMQLPVLSSDWSLPDFDNVTNTGILMSLDLPILLVKVWLPILV